MNASIVLNTGASLKGFCQKRRRRRAAVARRITTCPPGFLTLAASLLLTYSGNRRVEVKLCMAFISIGCAININDESSICKTRTESVKPLQSCSFTDNKFEKLYFGKYNW